MGRNEVGWRVRRAVRERGTWKAGVAQRRGEKDRSPEAGMAECRGGGMRIRAGKREGSRGMDARWGIGSCRGRRRAASGRTWTFIFLYAAMSLIVLGGSGRI